MGKYCHLQNATKYADPWETIFDNPNLYFLIRLKMSKIRLLLFVWNYYVIKSFESFFVPIKVAKVHQIKFTFLTVIWDTKREQKLLCWLLISTSISYVFRRKFFDTLSSTLNDILSPSNDVIGWIISFLFIHWIAINFNPKIREQSNES